MGFCVLMFDSDVGVFFQPMQYKIFSTNTLLIFDMVIYR